MKQYARALTSGTVAFVLAFAMTADAQTGVTRKVWRGRTLSNLQSLADNPSVLGPPTSTASITALFEGPTNDTPAPFVTTYSGQVRPSVTGAYRFQIACNYKCMLWVNTSPSFTGVAPVARMMQSVPPSARQWTRYAEQTSATINMVANSVYTVLVVMISNNTTTNHIAVGWQLPSGTYERPMLGTTLTSYTFPIVDTTAPTVSFTAPAASATVSTTTTITANATDTFGVVGVQFKVDGVNIGSEDTASPYSVSWNTLGVANGIRSLTATARDAAGNTAIVSRAVTVSNVTAPPTVSFTANPTSIENGQSATLSFSTSNATSCTASSVPSLAAWTGAKATNGTQSVTPTTTTVFTYACSNAGGTTTRTATVTLQGFNMTVGWDPSPDSGISAYQISYGNTSGNWTTQVDVGTALMHRFTSFPGTGRYYFVVRAFASDGTASQPTREIWADVTTTGFSDWCCLYTEGQNTTTSGSNSSATITNKTTATTTTDGTSNTLEARVTSEATFALPELYVFGDGNTGANYDTDIVVLNPNDFATTAHAVFYKPNGSTAVKDLTLLAKSRQVLRADEIAGLSNTSFYMTLETDSTKLVVERSTFWDSTYYGGSTERAEQGASRDWYFADGGQGQLSTKLVLTNPQPTANTATVQFMLEGGGTVEKTYNLAAGAKTQILASSVAGLANKAFGTQISFAQDGLAERVITLNQKRGGGTSSLGSTITSDRWFHTDGVTGTEFDTYVLTLNPNNWPVEITYQFMLTSGVTKQAKTILPARSRGTLNPKLVDAALQNAVFSVAVQATSPIVSERAIFWGNPWIESASSFGSPDPSMKWAVADVRTGTTKMFETYILVANSNSIPVDLTMTIVKDDGSTVVQSYTVKGTSRISIPTQSIPGMANSQFSVIVEAGLPVTVESTMFWNSNGVKWAGGSNVLATPLP